MVGPQKTCKNNALHKLTNTIDVFLGYYRKISVFVLIQNISISCN